MRLRIGHGLVVGILALGACEAMPPPPIVAKPVQLADGQVISPAMQAGLDSRSIELARVQIDIPRGSEIGRLSGQFGNKCLGARTGPIYQERPRLQDGSNEWNDTFYRVMSGHGFKVADSPDQLFQSRQRDGGDLQFGVIISEMRIDAQAVCDFFSERAVGMRAIARIMLEWQIFDPVRSQVILKHRSEGNFQSTQTLALDGQLALQQAFADAVNKLAASSDLRRTMLDQPRPEAFPPTGSPVASRMPLRRLAQSQQPIDGQIDRVRNATVLIEVGASGHGSGFIISESGLMVTNQHVVGSQRFVRVRLLSGRTVVGEVLRQHDRRDVALVKLEGSGYPALPIRETPVRVAEEVYVVGAPSKVELGWTVTRGVISAYRQAVPPERLDIIQSDVGIHGGNSGGPMLDKTGSVIAICVAAIRPGQDKTVNEGLNLFIPILDGLDKLGLDLVDPAEYERRRRQVATQ